MQQGSRKIWAWATALACLAVIYGTLPVSARFYNYLVKAVPFPLWLNTCALFFVFVLVILFLKKVTRLGQERTFAFILNASIYLFLVLRTSKPDVKIHFIAYCLLGFLTANALAFDMNAKTAFAAACALVLLAGWGDELLQILAPNRAFEFRDVFMNGAAGGFGALFRSLAGKSGPLD